MKNALLDRIFTLIRDHAVSVADIVARLECADSAVRRHIKTLHAIRAVHIVHYRHKGDYGNQEAVYAWGEGQDAPVPNIRKPRSVDLPVSLPSKVALGPWGCVW